MHIHRLFKLSYIWLHSLNLINCNLTYRQLIAILIFLNVSYYSVCPALYSKLVFNSTLWCQLLFIPKKHLCPVIRTHRVLDFPVKPRTLLHNLNISNTCIPVINIPTKAHKFNQISYWYIKCIIFNYIHICASLYIIFLRIFLC